MSTPEAFQKLNELYFSGQQNLSLKVLINEIEAASSFFFSKDHTNHDYFFNQFTPIWIDLLRKGRYTEAEEIWHIALQIADSWEKKNPRVHKGTPFYFLGVSQILKKNLEDGFLSIHQALEEDIITHGTTNPSTAAYFFTTLDYEAAHQFFKPKVVEISEYLEKRIDDYHNTRSGKLTLEQFKDRFLENTDLREEVYIFVYSLFRLKKILIDTEERLLQNELSSILHGKMFFDLCLVIEKSIEYKNPESSRNPKLMFRHEIQFLMDQGIMSITQSQRDTINADFNNDFGTTLQEIIENRYAVSIPKIEEDIMIAYRIRNFAAHKIEKQTILYEKNLEINQRLFNALFYVFERLYPSSSSKGPTAPSTSTTTTTTTSTKTNTTTSATTTKSKSHETAKTNIPLNQREN